MGEGQAVRSHRGCGMQHRLYTGIASTLKLISLLIQFDLKS